MLTNRQKNIAFESHSGTGKTRGMLITAIDRIDADEHQTQCLIFCATFDSESCTPFIASADLKIDCGLVSKNDESGLADHDHQHTHILIGTPNEMLGAIAKYKSNASVDEVSR